jgi:hypothetical protein
MLDASNVCSQVAQCQTELINLRKDVGASQLAVMGIVERAKTDLAKAFGPANKELVALLEEDTQRIGNPVNHLEQRLLQIKLTSVKTEETKRRLATVTTQLAAKTALAKQLHERLDKFGNIETTRFAELVLERNAA